MLLAVSYVNIGKRPTPLIYAHAQHKNRILALASLPILLPICVLVFLYYHFEHVVLC